jgi:hypothetical protein
VSWVETVVEEMSRRGKEVEELVVGRRRAVRRNCAAEVEGMERSWRKSPRGSTIGRLHRRRPRRMALCGWRVNGP